MATSQIHSQPSGASDGTAKFELPMDRLSCLRLDTIMLIFIAAIAPDMETQKVKFPD